MYFCRKCQEPATDVRRDWDRETVDLIYIHEDGREHRVKVQSLDAQKLVNEDEMRARYLWP